MKKRLYEIVVVMLAALMLTAIGCGDDDKEPVDGDTDEVVDGDVTEEDVDGDVTEDVEVDGDETEDVEVDGDVTEDVEVDGDVADEEPVVNVCDPNPCDGAEDPNRTLCVEDSGETNGYRCDCAAGYEDVTYTDPQAGDVTVCWAEEAVCTADVTVTFDDNGMYTNTDDTTGAGNDFVVFIDPDYRCAQPASWTMDGLDHVYALDLAVGDVLEIDVTVDGTSTPEFDPALIISDSCSNRVQCLGAADSGGDAEAETLTFEAETAGTYFVSVDSGYAAEGEYASHAYGAYTLNMMKYSIEACTANETVAMDSLPWTGDYELNAADDQDITASCMGETVTGSDKVFSVALTADQEVIVTVEPIATPTKADTDFDPFVYMMDATCYNIGPDATCLAGANRYGAGMTESLVFTAPADGTYYIVVDTLLASVTDSHFTITVDTFTATACEGTEISALPYTSTDATTVGGMDNIALSCGDGYGIGADDIYWMAMTADQMIELELTSDEALVVMVADADGCILNNPGTCLAGDEEHILFTAPADGTYFFVVDSLDASEGAYTLDVKAYVPVPCTGTEIAALPFEVTDGTTVGGSNDIELTCGGDAATGNDVIYSIAMEADDVIDITLGGVADDVNLMVMVADAEGCILNNPGTCLTSAADTIRFTATEAATYFIIVDSLDDTEGAYTLNVAEFVPLVCVGDETITTETLPFSSEVDLVDQPASRWSVYNSCAEVANLYSYAGREILYAIDVEAGDAYVFNAAPAADSGMDPGLIILKACYSNAMEMSECFAGVDDGFADDPEELMVQFDEAGTYFVIVDTYTSDDEPDLTGLITLTVSAVEATADQGEECSVNPECLDTTDGICHEVLDEFESPYNFCSVSCATDTAATDCANFASGCCIVADGETTGYCSVAAGCGEAGMTALLGDACAFPGIDVNVAMCSTYGDTVDSACFAVGEDLTFCTRPCDLGNDDCGDDITDGCCVDTGGYGTWCVPAETGYCGE